MGRLDRGGNMRAGVEGEQLAERVFVQGPADRPRLRAIAPQVAVAQVFHPDEALLVVVKINLRHPHADPRQESRDRHVIAVLLPLPAVLGQDQRMLVADSDAIEFSIRATFFQGMDDDLLPVKTGKSNDGFFNEIGIGSHEWRNEI